MSLYEHQKIGVNFLVASRSAMLADDMGLGKSRQALYAAQELFSEHKIDRVLVLAPAAVRQAWREEINKLEHEGMQFIPCIYDSKTQTILGAGKREGRPLPVLLVSYTLLPQKRHVEALESWCSDGKTLLVCDESSFLKNRTAKQTKSSARISAACSVRWLLTGTPIANSPLDLYGQGMVMEPQNGNGHNWKGFTRGPLKGFGNWYHFQARYAVLKQMNMGSIRFKQVVGYQNIDELTKRFAPYVLRRTKTECLDLPAKSYTIREVALSEETWRIYQELRKEALLALPDEDVRPEPNAAVRILRLCQLTSGYVGTVSIDGEFGFHEVPLPDAPQAKIISSYVEGQQKSRDVSSEKLDWLVDALLDGELQSEQAVIVWCRWRRERERLQQMLATKLEVYGVFGGQQEKNRSFNVQSFQTSTNRRVLLGQQAAGGYGLTLTAAHTVVYLSNSGSHVHRVQSEARVDRIGQKFPCLYMDIFATGPKGQRTVDHHMFYDILMAKKDIAEITCAGWRRILAD
jgi:SNF2 family DNA or RNA helicase